MSQASKRRVLALYKQLLRDAAHFPSVKRSAIIQDIKLEFREKASLTDPAKVQHAIDVAMQGLGTMQKYTGLDKKSKSWRVSLEDSAHPSAKIADQLPKDTPQAVPSVPIEGIPQMKPRKL